MSFTATARIPCRPLSADNKNLAERKELLVDYKQGEVIICKEDGTFVNLTNSIKELIEKEIDISGSADSIIINIDGIDYTLQTIIANDRTRIRNIEDALGYKAFTNGENISVSFDIIDKINNIISTDKDGNPYISADKIVNIADFNKLASSIKPTDNYIISGREYLTLKSIQPSIYTQITVGTNWNGSSAPFNQIIKNVSLPISSSMQTLRCSRPIVDIVLNSNYDTAMKELEEYTKIFSIELPGITDIYPEFGSLIVKAVERTTIPINLRLYYGVRAYRYPGNDDSTIDFMNVADIRDGWYEDEIVK